MSSIPHQGAQSVWIDQSVAQRYVNAENASAPFAKLLVSKTNFSGDNVKVLDLATGTGVAVKEVYAAMPREQWGRIKVVGSDVSQPMLDYLKHRGEEAGWEGLEVKIVDGNDMGNLENGEYTHVLCTFGIFMIPNALKGLYDITKKRGFVGVSTWGNMAWMSLTTTCISRMPSQPYNPTASEVTAKFYNGKPWGDPDFVAQQLQEAGFEKVETQVQKIVARVGSPDVFVESMQFPLNMIITSFWPEDKREEYLNELNDVMRKEVEGHAKDGVVEMEFEGICAWGWKA